MKLSASLFTGGGGFDIGAMQAGYKPVWGIEIEPQIAEYAERNIKDFRVIVSDVSTVDYSILPCVDHLHLSPVCKNASVANSQGGEAPEDIEAARASCRAIEAIQPETVTLENVWAYRDFEAFHLIIRCLIENGYRLDWWHLNAADYGVPQTRKRLILIADKNRQPQRPQPTHSETPDMFGVYKPWIGWYEAIEDLLPELPESQFAPWQLERLPDELQTMAVSNQGFGDSFVVGSQYGRFSEVHNRPPQTRLWNDPYFALTASGAAHGDQRAFIGHVVKLTPRALARFQSFPDWYDLPDANGLACKIVGNAVPCLLAQRIMESLG